MKRTRLFKKVAVFVLAAAATTFSQVPRQEELLNGLRLLLWPDVKADKVTVRIRVHSGSAFDPQGKEGTMQLLADDLFPNDASREFFREDLGGDLELVTTHDYIQINASSTPDQFLTMLETLSSALANPAIDKETTNRLRNSLAARLKALETDPAYSADRAISARLLGTFPYGRPALGTPASVQNITFADLIDAKQRFLTADNATVSISGNFDKNLAFKAVRRYFGGWSKADRRIPATFKQPDDVPTGLLVIDSPVPGVAAVRAAFRGTSRGGKDFASSEIYARILETRLKNRIPAENAASVFVRNEARFQPGLVVIGFAASKNDVSTGRGSGNGKIEANDLITKAMADPITDAEFASARSDLAAARQKKAADEFWLDADTYKLTSAEADRSALDKVTLADVRGLADRFQHQPLAIVLAAPAK